MIQLGWPSETDKVPNEPRGLQQIQDYVQKDLVKANSLMLWPKLYLHL